MLYLPQGLPAIEPLLKEHYKVATYTPHQVAGVPKEAIQILFLNLMPQKAVTELDIARATGKFHKDVALIPMKIAGQTYKTTPQSHMDAFYTDFEYFENQHFDGLIITGAPVEHLAFEKVRYWEPLCRIMDWANTHAKSTLYICWGAQAGLYHHYGIPKYSLPDKMFGIFNQKKLDKDAPILTDFPNLFPMPNSRHTEVRAKDILEKKLNIVAQSEESGVGIVTSPDGKKQIFIVGHLEYEPETLHKEYLRDLSKGLPINPPLHYYKNDTPQNGIDFSWKETAQKFYQNWLGLCI